MNDGRREAGVLDLARSGSLDAFETLLAAHERQVLGVALRILGRLEDGQEAAQEVFLRLHRNLKRFRHIEEVRPWLYRVTVNVCCDVARRRRRWPAALPAHFEARSLDAGPDRLAEQEERMRHMEEALTRLPERERAALVLREIEGLSTREVAAALGVSEVTVRSQISKARLRLRKAMSLR